MIKMRDLGRSKDSLKVIIERIGSADMAGIWGIIDFTEKKVEAYENQSFEQGYASCIVDRIDVLDKGHAYFGCAHQYFSKEAEYEILPYFDEESNCLFTIDAYLTNRVELIDRLEKEIPVRKPVTTDGELIIALYKKYGNESFSMLEGSYAIAIYDYHKNEVILVSDVVSSRVLYYRKIHEKFYFSTLLNPLVHIENQLSPKNERWCVDFLAQDSLEMATESKETPYSGIYKVEPGQYLIFSKQTKSAVDYWNPYHSVLNISKKTDKEIKKNYIDVFSSSVENSIRLKDQVALLLSGGLDSTSVACFAAPYLKKQGKKLITFTSVPETDFVNNWNRNHLVNEKEKVQITAEYLGNLEMNFNSVENQNCWEGSMEFLKIFEVPIKVLNNAMWIYDCMKDAYEKKCRVILNGQYGNTTISLGDFDMYMYSLRENGHFIKLWQEINIVGKKYRYPRKKIVKDIVSQCLPQSYWNIKYNKKVMFRNVCVKKEYIKKYNLKKRYLKEGRNLSIYKGISFASYNKYIYYKEALSQIGEMETKLSLATGVLIQDPTRTKKIIQLCISLPYEQFVQKDIDRRLVKEYLKEYLPDYHIKNYWEKGLQSADMCHRLNKSWNKIYNELIDIFSDESCLIFVDREEVKKKLIKYKDGINEQNEAEVQMILYYAHLIQFYQFC